MKNILSNWNIMRLLRLAMGVFVVWQGVLAHEWALVVMGCIFSLLAIFNIGCCGTAACNIAAKSQKSQNKDITFEEIK